MHKKYNSNKIWVKKLNKRLFPGVMGTTFFYLIVLFNFFNNYFFITIFFLHVDPIEKKIK